MKGQYSCTGILKPWKEDPRADRKKSARRFPLSSNSCMTLTPVLSYGNQSILVVDSQEYCQHSSED